MLRWGNIKLHEESHRTFDVHFNQPSFDEILLSNYRHNIFITPIIIVAGEESCKMCRIRSFEKISCYLMEGTLKFMTDKNVCSTSDEKFIWQHLKVSKGCKVPKFPLKFIIQFLSRITLVFWWLPCVTYFCQLFF